MSTIYLLRMPGHTTHKAARSGFVSWVLAGGLLSAVPALAQFPVHIANTTGQVGHHMVAETRIPRGSCSDSGDSFSVPYVVGGSLPLGMRIEGSDIVGTPKQPGRWLVTLRYDRIRCKGKDYPAQDVPVTFDIQGIAPRRIQ